MAHDKEDKSTILVVDDTPISLRLLVDLLTEKGYTVRPALSGESALLEVEKLLPDLILLDIMMSDMDGYEVCQRLKADVRTRDIPVIFVSALDQTFDKVRGFEAGGVDYITKPFQVEEVLVRVKTHLALRRLQQQVETQNIQLKKEIADRQQAEEILRQNEAKYRLLAENSSDAVALVEDDTVVYLSPAYENMLGYSTEEIRSKGLRSDFSLIHPDDVARIAALIKQGRRGQLTEQKYSYRIKHKAGHYIWIEDVIKREFDVSDRLLRVIINTREITDRMQFELALRESEERYRIISEAVSNIAYVYQVDETGALTRVWATEEATQRVTGYSYAEIDAQGGWLSLIQPDDLAEVAAHHERLVEGQTSAVEYRISAKTGTIRWMRELTRPIKNNKQQVTHLYGGCQDITEQKQLEEQLRQSQKMEAIGHLAGGVAHHFNNLLTTIMGYVDLSLLELPADHSVAKDLQIIKRTTQRAATLTRQLLTFTRKQVVQPTFLNLNELVQSTEQMLRQLVNESIELQTDLTTGLGYVKMDASQFEQLLVNFVVNARDAMPKGGRLVIGTKNVAIEESAGLQAEIPGGHYVQLIITDSGVGMSESIKEHIFEPFFTTKEVGQGTGLGLSTCFGIIKQHNGYITVDSEPGCGTTFNIFLPWFENPTDHTPFINEEALPKGTETILLVEDEVNVRGLAGRILREQGYNVLEASNGQDALHLLTTQPAKKLDLLLADVVMPHLGGIDLATRLLAEDPDLKILLMSGYTDSVISPEEIQRLNGTFLLKPFTRSKLAQSVRDVLDHRPKD